VLGHASSESIPVDRGFLDLGFDSLTAVELRKPSRRRRRPPASGDRAVRHPDPARLAALLDERLPVEKHGPGTPSSTGWTRLWPVSMVTTRHVEAGRAVAVLLAELGEPMAEPARDEETRVEQATDAELFSLIDELGVE